MPDAMYGFGLARTDTQMEAYLASSLPSRSAQRSGPFGPTFLFGPRASVGIAPDHINVILSDFWDTKCMESL